MSKHETPLTRKYWEAIGGLLIEEFRVVKNRWIDGVIVLNENTENMDEIIRGWFYFRLIGKNLVGEFSNNLINENIIHIALKNNSLHIYEGIYDTEWDENYLSIHMNLVISNLGNNRFELVWRNPLNNNEITYKGLGTIVDGILIGSYDNLDTENRTK